MKPEINLMHRVWDGLVTANRKQTELPEINFDEIISSVFSTGPFYFYIIDFFDLSISHISPGFQHIHNVPPDEIRTINDVLSLIHADDMKFVSETEKAAYDFLYSKIGKDKLTRYKVSYNLRFSTGNDTCRLFNHQALVLTVDEHGNYVKSLNIHTDISHVTQKNNKFYSLIGLSGEPSYLNLQAGNPSDNAALLKSSFSLRELEIIKLVALGMGAKQISDALHLSIHTVYTHRKNILHKSGCKNISELIARGISEGWI